MWLPCVLLQEEKIAGLQAFANQLIQGQHYAAAEIADRRASVLARWSKLKDTLVDLKKKLGESKSVQQFFRDADETEAWMSERLQTASDESYRDPTDLQVSCATLPHPHTPTSDSLLPIHPPYMCSSPFEAFVMWTVQTAQQCTVICSCSLLLLWASCVSLKLLPEADLLVYLSLCCMSTGKSAKA